MKDTKTYLVPSIEHHLNCAHVQARPSSLVRTLVQTHESDETCGRPSWQSFLSFSPAQANVQVEAYDGDELAEVVVVVLVRRKEEAGRR